MASKRKFTLALSSELAAAVAAENNSLNDKAASSTPKVVEDPNPDSSPVPANNPTSAQNQQKLSANSLPNDDDDEDLSSSVSVVTLLNNNNNSGQDCLRVQELFRKSPVEGIRWEIDDIDIGLAINIRNGLMNRIGTDGTTLTLTTLQHSNVLPQQSLPGISQEHTKNQLQEKCKALFLRTRNNSTDLYEELIIRMCNISKTDDRLGSLVKDATDQPKLRKDQLIVTKLGIFVRMVTKKVLIAMIMGEDTQQVIKTCDEITFDLKIPTKPGVVKELSVRELLG
ncbi:11549_t:CDS:2 [Funneliformis mosseae]|uniref:11549_t:CDS:1 n=1 Tax=Funneliformis mosseae TaxID=27381 RepID=A0A9N9EVB2_FUNMO|nr:11549_t:CDS:2 [Funneliformis mosseae]